MRKWLRSFIDLTTTRGLAVGDRVTLDLWQDSAHITITDMVAGVSSDGFTLSGSGHRWTHWRHVAAENRIALGTMRVWRS